MSIIVYGSQGCGKTLNKAALNTDETGRPHQDAGYIGGEIAAFDNNERPDIELNVCVPVGYVSDV